MMNVMKNENTMNLISALSKCAIAGIITYGVIMLFVNFVPYAGIVLLLILFSIITNH